MRWSSEISGMTVSTEYSTGLKQRTSPDPQERSGPSRAPARPGAAGRAGRARGRTSL